MDVGHLNFILHVTSEVQLESLSLGNGVGVVGGAGGIKGEDTEVVIALLPGNVSGSLDGGELVVSHVADEGGDKVLVVGDVEHIDVVVGSDGTHSKEGGGKLHLNIKY